MAFETIVYPDVAQEQLKKHNESHAILRKPFHPAAGTDYAVIGCLVADTFDSVADETALVAALVAKPQITAVANPRLYGQSDTVIEANPAPPADPTYEWVVHASTYGTWRRGVDGGKSYSESVTKSSDDIRPPDGKKWIVLFIVIPAPLDPAGRTALESAVESVPGINVCKLILDGTIPDDALGTITLVANVHMRIDTIPIAP